MKSYFFILFSILFLVGCTKEETRPASTYKIELSFPDESEAHPKKDDYQAVIDEYVSKGIIGTSVMIKNDEGTWLGAAGSSDLASNVPTEVNHQFLIASISKMYTAACIFRLVDNGILSIDDPISNWVDADIIDNIDNAKEATIKHLLGHTSGIHDYYTTAFEMSRYNEFYNDRTAKDILKFTYDKKAYFPVGTEYWYTNSNYLLLGFIIEKASGLSLQDFYQQHIFTPLGLKNTSFAIRGADTPNNLIKGYYYLYGGGYTESEFLYKDELGTGDGGIATNVQDLGVFLDALFNAEIVSSESLAQMQDWFDISDEGDKNGYGIEYFTGDYGIYYGHTGGVDGFSSFARYYPEQDTYIAILINMSPGPYADFLNLDAYLEAIEEVVFK